MQQYAVWILGGLAVAGTTATGLFEILKKYYELKKAKSEAAKQPDSPIQLPTPEQVARYGRPYREGFSSLLLLALEEKPETCIRTCLIDFVIGVSVAIVAIAGGLWPFTRTPVDPPSDLIELHKILDKIDGDIWQLTDEMQRPVTNFSPKLQEELSSDVSKGIQEIIDELQHAISVIMPEHRQAAKQGEIASIRDRFASFQKRVPQEAGHPEFAAEIEDARQKLHRITLSLPEK
jgi:hypothetical protein